MAPIPQRGGGVPGQPDNPAASKALGQAIAAIGIFIHVEQDQQDKMIAAQALGILHRLQGQRAVLMAATPPPPPMPPTQGR